MKAQRSVLIMIQSTAPKESTPLKSHKLWSFTSAWGKNFAVEPDKFCGFLKIDVGALISVDNCLPHYAIDIDYRS